MSSAINRVTATWRTNLNLGLFSVFLLYFACVLLGKGLKKVE